MDIQAFGKVLKENVDRFAATRPDDPKTRETTRTLGDALGQFVDIAAYVDSGDEALTRLTTEDMDRIGDHVLTLMEAVVDGVQGHGAPADQAMLQRAVAGASVWLARAGHAWNTWSRWPTPSPRWPTAPGTRPTLQNSVYCSKRC